MSDSTIDLGRCVTALFLASIAAAFCYVTPLFWSSFGLYALAFAPQVWLFCFIASMIGVFPVFIYSERLRNPPGWLAVTWGTVLAWVAARIAFGPYGFSSRLAGSVYAVAPGAVAGIAYVMAVSRLSRQKATPVETHQLN